jgi:hypothetical protein
MVRAVSAQQGRYGTVRYVLLGPEGYLTAPSSASLEHTTSSLLNVSSLSSVPNLLFSSLFGVGINIRDDSLLSFARMGNSRARNETVGDEGGVRGYVVSGSLVAGVRTTREEEGQEGGVRDADAISSSRTLHSTRIDHGARYAATIPLPSSQSKTSHARIDTGLRSATANATYTHPSYGTFSPRDTDGEIAACQECLDVGLDVVDVALFTVLLVPFGCFVWWVLMVFDIFKEWNGGKGEWF